MVYTIFKTCSAVKTRSALTVVSTAIRTGTRFLLPKEWIILRNWKTLLGRRVFKQTSEKIPLGRGELNWFSKLHSVDSFAAYCNIAWALVSVKVSLYSGLVTLARVFVFVR